MFTLRRFVSACLIASVGSVVLAEPVTPPVTGGNDTLEARSDEGNAADASTSAPDALEPTAEASEDVTAAAPISTLLPEEPDRLTIALVMPPDGSPFTAASKIVGNGLLAASQTSREPAEVLLVEAPESTSLTEVLQSAVVAGADVVVGPLQKERVTELIRIGTLPLPVVALNHPSEAIPDAEIPANLVMMSLSTENEAEYIARLAVAALEESTPEAPVPTIPAPDTSVPTDSVPALPGAASLLSDETAALPAPERQKILILSQSGAWETRIAESYAKVLTASGTPFEIYRVDDMDLKRLREKVQPVLSEEDERRFAQRRQELRHLPGTTESERRIRDQALKRLDSDMAVRRAESTPPYAGILLALDAQSASIVRTSLPRKSRVWGTSTSNPGDPAVSSAATALAFDLEGLVFAECPLLLRYDAQSFTARFAAAMPYSPAAKRLFAFGADAFGVAERWAQSTRSFEMEGETGRLVLDRDRSPVVERTPQTVLVREGHLIEVATESVARPGPLPEVSIPSRQTLSVKEVLPAKASVTVVPVIIEDVGPEQPAPSKMLPAPVRTEPSAPAAPAATPPGIETRPFETPFEEPGAAAAAPMTDAPVSDGEEALPEPSVL